MDNIAVERRNESICTFARQLDYRSLDPLIIRAVYEELAFWCWNKKTAFPLRANDSIAFDLEVDAEDLVDIGEAIASRTHRSFEDTEQNPWFGKVKTAGDLVAFFNAQPKLKAE